MNKIMRNIYFIITIFLISNLMIYSCSNKINSSNPINNAINNDDFFNLFFYFPMFIDLEDKSGKTPLTSAIENNNLKGVIKLVNLGANINKMDYYGYTPLIYSVILKRGDIIKFLIKNKVNLNLYDIYGDNALTKSVSIGDFSILEELLKHNPKVDLPDKDGNTALMKVIMIENNSSTYESRRYMAELLLRRNANVNFKNKKGESPLMRASLPSETGIIDVISKIRYYDPNLDMWLYKPLIENFNKR